MNGIMEDIMEDEQIEELSPFELTLFLERHVLPASRHLLLNAGRGNPNWTAPVPREAYFLLGTFATQETLKSQTELTAHQIRPHSDRLARFHAFLSEHTGRGADFLEQCITSDETLLGMTADSWLTKACDGIIGDNYPEPNRCLTACEGPLKNYLSHELFGARQLEFDVFPVEGGTAGICYLFDTLKHTALLKPGERIALFLPTFAPYLEIPKLPQYNFEVVPIRAKQIDVDGHTSYFYPLSELNKLRDSNIKVAFLVNPSNPTANAMSPENIQQVSDIVHDDRPDLMFITDDVYGTFVPDFLSLFAVLPYNTACLYSFSKYFGATGWRVGAIAVAKDNVFDKLIAQRASEAVIARYSSLSSDSATLSFIDRLVADSRDIALNHAAGLSTPQQIMIALFSLYGILQDGQTYKYEVIDICRERERQLFEVLGLREPLAALDTAYYCDINLMKWMSVRYGDLFADYMGHKFTPTQVLVLLAQREQLILLKTSPFGSNAWSMRVSLANLATSQYAEVGQRIISLFNFYYTEWQEKEV